MKKEIKNIEGKMMPQNIELEKSVLGCIISYQIGRASCRERV